MNKQVMMLAGALSLVGCGGSGVPWSGGGSDAGPVPIGNPGSNYQTLGGTSATGGGIAVGGTSAAGGAESGGTSYGGSEVGGGYEAGGTSYGGSEAGGGYEAGGTSYGGYDAGGGYAAGGTGYAGYGTGGTESGGYGSGGTGSQNQTCAQSVTHCFDAAANCYEYSPWSDCDQIEDVCAAMQAACGE
jgi:hypothetical protein